MINEHGVHTQPEEFYRQTKNGTETVLTVGQYSGLWGYGCEVRGKTSGFFVPCMPLVHKYESREQAKEAARCRSGVPIETQLTLWPDTGV